MKEIVKHVFTYLDCLIKPALSEVGEILADNVKVLRHRNQLRLAKKVEEIHKSRGVLHPNTIPLKTFANLLQASSLEEDELLSDMWANLLANATDPSKEVDYCNTFVKVLSELSSLEAQVLDRWYSNQKENPELDELFPERVLSILKLEKLNQAGEPNLVGELMCDNFFRLGVAKLTSGGVLELTYFGKEFLKYCRKED